MLGKLPSMPIRVALAIPRLEPLTYAVTDDQSVLPGMRVLVPLGNRLVTGTVVETNVATVDDMRTVAEVLDDTPTFPADMLELARRVGEYYLCSWGEVLAAALPSGMKPTTVVTIHRERAVSASELEQMRRRAPRRAALLEVIDDLRGDVTLAYLQKRLKYKGVADQLQALVRDQYIRLSSSVSSAPSPRMVRAVSLNMALTNDETVRTLFDQLDKRAPKQSLALAVVWMAHRSGQTPLTVSAVAEQAGVSTAVVDGLIERRALDVQLIPALRSKGARPKEVHDETQLILTGDQQSAVSRIIQGINAGTFDPILVHGVTGSGKTLIYQQAIRRALSKGRSTLLLVPEISLTPQLGDRFGAAFGERIAILHSRLSEVERLLQVERIARGEVDIVIGPRSAVFCPIPNLGLIVVDEEHESSYKQDDPSPRYHGRDVAIMRAQILGCPVVLGSATPSLESLHNVALGRFTRVLIPTRADAAHTPQIRIVDMRQARKSGSVAGSMSHQALDAIADRVRLHEGSIVFLNRRGFAPEVQCRDCGNTPTCPNCDVSLTFHRMPATLRCHYCSYSEVHLSACNVCGSVDVDELGAGTQRIEQELASAMKERHGMDLRIGRIDADTTTRRGSLRSILKSFAGGDLDVVVGTQMIAKGLDIPRVTLVVVVNADRTLYMSDFRASERTFQLLTQVAGRSGRAQGRPGEVVIQSAAPEHPVLRVVAMGESITGPVTDWYQDELAQRREVGYPPFMRFIVIEVSAMDRRLVEDQANILQALIPERSDYHSRSTVVLPAVAWIRNHHRRLIIVRNDKETDPSGQRCRALLRSVMQTYHDRFAARDVRVSIDIDANGLL
jgi:primosomal protein N' (replication factor Y)